jgi:hypothetical protein
MFRSSVAAFYALPEYVFYNFASPVRRHRFHRFRLLLRIRSEVEKIVHWMSQILFAAEIAFRGLNRCVAQQELNLLKLATAVVAQFRTGPAKVVWCNVVQTCSLTAISDDIPNNVLRDTMPPDFSLACDRSEDFALRNVGSTRPLVKRGFDPVRDGHSANVATFADQVDHGPMTLAHLEIGQLQANQFRSSKPAAE